MCNRCEANQLAYNKGFQDGLNELKHMNRDYTDEELQAWFDGFQDGRRMKKQEEQNEAEKERK